MAAQLGYLTEFPFVIGMAWRGSRAAFEGFSAELGRSSVPCKSLICKRMANTACRLKSEGFGVFLRLQFCLSVA
jgi:hypothetical protein